MGLNGDASRCYYQFLDFARWLKRFNVTPVFVFDGCKLEAKAGEIERRKAKRKRLLDRVDHCRHELAKVQSELLRNQADKAEPQLRAEPEEPSEETEIVRDVPETPPPKAPRANQWRRSVEIQSRVLTQQLENLEGQVVWVSPQQIADCQTLLRLAGIPVLVAQHDSEASCAAMCASGQVAAVISEDMDTLAFGSAVLLRDCRPQRRLATEIRLEVILDRLKLSYEQFVDVCILLGCDFSQAWRAVSHKDALPLIQEHGSIETVITVCSEGTEPPQSFTYQVARQVFLNPPRVSSEAFAQCLDVKAQPRQLDDFLRSKAQCARPYRRWAPPTTSE
jgi:5'-3' exonuclease